MSSEKEPACIKTSSGATNGLKKITTIIKKTGVEPVTLNRCRPIIKSVVGMYLRNRNSIRVMPVRSGTKAVAQVLTELIKHTEDISNADYVYRNCFLSGVIDSESYLCIDINESEK